MLPISPDWPPRFDREFREKMNRRLHPTLLLATLTLTLLFAGGCRRESPDAPIPPPIIELNDSFLRSLPGDSELRLGASLTAEQREATLNGLRGIRESLSPGPIGEIKHGLYAQATGSRTGAHRLVSQIESEGHVFFVIMNFETMDGQLVVSNVSFREIPFDVEARNRFDLDHRSIGALSGLLAGFASLAFILWALQDCFRARPRYRWLWLVVITICVPTQLINWGTGQWTPSSFEFVWFGIGTSQLGRIHPLVIHAGFPIFALFWWIARSRAHLAAIVSTTETDLE